MAQGARGHPFGNMIPAANEGRASLSGIVRPASQQFRARHPILQPRTSNLAGFESFPPPSNVMHDATNLFSNWNPFSYYPVSAKTTNWDPSNSSDWDQSKPTAQCLTRVARDLEVLYKDPVAGISVHTFESDVTKMMALITGPVDTPYDGGFFKFFIRCPPDYPAKSPRVRFLTTGAQTVGFNPNIYPNGKVCLSLLGTWNGPGWSSVWSLSGLLLSLQTLLNEFPYRNEPGLSSLPVTNAAVLNFNTIVRHETIRVAVIGVVVEALGAKALSANNDTGLVIEDNIETLPGTFTQVILDGFIGNFDKFVKTCQDHLGLHGQPFPLMGFPISRGRCIYQWKTMLARLHILKAKVEGTEPEMSIGVDDKTDTDISDNDGPLYGPSNKLAGPYFSGGGSGPPVFSPFNDSTWLPSWTPRFPQPIYRPGPPQPYNPFPPPWVNTHPPLVQYRPAPMYTGVTFQGQGAMHQHANVTTQNQLVPGIPGYGPGKVYYYGDRPAHIPGIHILPDFVRKAKLVEPRSSPPNDGHRETTKRPDSPFPGGQLFFPNRPPNAPYRQPGPRFPGFVKNSVHQMQQVPPLLVPSQRIYSPNMQSVYPPGVAHYGSSPLIPNEGFTVRTNNYRLGSPGPNWRSFGAFEFGAYPNADYQSSFDPGQIFRG